MSGSELFLFALVAIGVWAAIAASHRPATGGAGTRHERELVPVSPPTSTPPGEEWDDIMDCYSLQTRFFNRTEDHFYRALMRAMSGRYFVFAKVRLLDICSWTNNYSALNRISSKHVDFLICHPATLRPVAAIEVDGPSHQRYDRVKRDAFVDALFEQIGLPLVHIPAASWFEPADVARRIDDAVSAMSERPEQQALLSQNA